MAEPQHFKYVNQTWVGPGDTGDLPVYDHDGIKSSLWRLTDAELDEVKATGLIWLTVWADVHPAVYVSTENPFDEVEQ